MNRWLFFLCPLSFLLIPRFLYAQTAETASASTEATASDSTAADTSYWESSGVGTLNFTNTGYSTYWQAGGTNSLAITGLLSFNFDFDRAKHSWQTSIDLAYGTIRQGQVEADSLRSWQKADDRLDLQTKYGFKLNKKLRFGILAGLRTQIASGFAIDQTSKRELRDSVTSRAFAPAYLNFNLGIDFQPTKSLSIYYSPINSKMTFVGDEALAAFYIPVDDNGDVNTFRYELGSYLNVKYRKDELFKNVSFQVKADFFSNYLLNPQFIDVNAETLFSLKVNDWLTTSFFTNLIYDHDVQFNLVDEEGTPTGEQGDAVQFKHVLSVGITYKFLE